MPRLFALTGTPGTGKSSVARRVGQLSPSVTVLEVRDLVGPASRSSRAPPRIVDLAWASRRVRALARDRRPGTILLVGHLSHLLPVPRVIVLRCRPRELARRLRGRQSPRAWVRENREAELVDVVLAEALGLGRTVWELDTTGRPVEAVARTVVRILTGEVAPGHGAVDWLAEEPPRASDLARRSPRGARAPPTPRRHRVG